MYKFLLLIPTIPLSMLKTYTYLSYISMSGIGCALIGGILLIIHCGTKLSEGTIVPGDLKVFDAV